MNEIAISSREPVRLAAVKRASIVNLALQSYSEASYRLMRDLSFPIYKVGVVIGGSAGVGFGVAKIASLIGATDNTERILGFGAFALIAVGEAVLDFASDRRGFRNGRVKI